MDEQDFKRLAERLVIEGDHLLWIGGFGPAGYGHIGIEGKVFRAHRVAYEHWVGSIPPGWCVEHLCRIRSCCAPEHMKAVSPDESLRRARERVGEFTRATSKLFQPTNEPELSDVLLVLGYLGEVPGATKNQVVRNMIDSASAWKETRAKNVIRRVVELGLAGATRSGAGKTAAILHTLTAEGEALLGKRVQA